MTHSISRWARPVTSLAALSVCATLVACSSTKSSSTRDLEVQAAAATSRTETTRAAAKVEPTRDGRLVVTDGWGRPLPPPDLMAPRSAPAAVAPPVASTAPVTRSVVTPSPAASPETAIRSIGPSPAPVASQIAATNANVDAAVRKTLDDWRAAWSRGDADGYLKFYDTQFKGTSATRAEWEAQRRQRLSNRNIDLQLSDVRVLRSSADEADVRFVQHYRSASHADDGTKHVQLRRVGAEWKITAEAWINEKSQPKSLRKGKQA